MGILVLAILTGSIGAVTALIAGYAPLTVLAVYCVAGLASIPLVVLPLMCACVLRKRWAAIMHEKLNSEA
ncbi:hypothetical protein [Ruegeria arenilitoris]|uniref:hypothetical protein n=1 Tax=Ruegeria arenilitoris TaxID=1173585 RepID=UPI00147AAC34|nr:hypothetical protein [Ruegeria arenilitoris]